jgi:hypothetical protein
MGGMHFDTLLDNSNSVDSLLMGGVAGGEKATEGE